MALLVRVNCTSLMTAPCESTFFFFFFSLRLYASALSPLLFTVFDEAFPWYLEKEGDFDDVQW